MLFYILHFFCFFPHDPFSSNIPDGRNKNLPWKGLDVPRDSGSPFRKWTLRHLIIAEITVMVGNSFLSIALMFVDFESGWYKIRIIYLFICFISSMFCILIIYFKESIQLIHTSCRNRSKQTNLHALYSLVVLWIYLLNHIQRVPIICNKVSLIDIFPRRLKHKLNVLNLTCLGGLRG